MVTCTMRELGDCCAQCDHGPPEAKPLAVEVVELRARVIELEGELATAKERLREFLELQGIRECLEKLGREDAERRKRLGLPPADE